MKITFEKPFVWESKEYTEIESNYDDLKGSVLLQISNQFRNAGKMIAVPATDMEYCAELAARACNQPVEFIEALPVKYAYALVQEAQTFLFSTLGNLVETPAK